MVKLVMRLYSNLKQLEIGMAGKELKKEKNLIYRV
jgi:hypothetical protein